MSGGFFRGTSADQDTRFSNKQAKLLKTQKFASELEHLVDMTKVKMDVMRPWIANRVTELLGFEDEVLINFIYGLLDGKEVNGKEVQISLTGFMEKNTGKFMKELWTLLLSAQNNSSGVPQQFLDAKEEEARKKKEETDRIADEIRRKRDKESRELEQEKSRKMDGEDQAKNADADPRSSERLASKASNARFDDGEDMSKRNGMRGRSRVSRSSRRTDHSSSSSRSSDSRSISKSLSNSRSHSDERRHRSRSISRSPRTRGRSDSSEKVHFSPRRRSLTHRRRYSPREPRSPPRRRSSYYRRRSRSRSYHRSISPIRQRMRSPIRRRSRSPVHRRSVTPTRRRRSPSPVRRRSPPLRRRLPSPVRRRSPPLRPRSPSPVGRQSPYARSPSPMGRRSSSRVRKSPSPIRGRSPVAVRRRSPSPVRRRLRSPVRHRSPLSMQDRSLSPLRRRSPSPVTVRRKHRSRSAPRQRSPPVAQGRSPGRRSVTPSQRSSNESSSPSRIRHHPLSPVRRSPVIRRTPVQSSKGRMRVHESPVRGPRNHHEDKRSSSPGGSPVRQVRNQVMRDRHLDSPKRLGKLRQHHDSSDSSEQQKEKYNARKPEDHISKSEEKRPTHSRSTSKHDGSTLEGHKKDYSYPERASNNQTSGYRGHTDSSEIRNKDQERFRERTSGKGARSEISNQMSPPLNKASSQDEFFSVESKKSEDKTPSDIVKDKDQPNNVSKSVEKFNNQLDSSSDTALEESQEGTYKLKRRKKHKRSKRRVDSDSDSYDSEAEERREAKRRRKEEKKLRKEERRHRREERRRRKEERRAEKLKAKRRNDDSALLDDENHSSENDSLDGEQVTRKKSRAGSEEPEKEQKKLEIELRMKALESFKARKGALH